jgi:glucose-6-phosphate 1-dehydrogenase
MDDGSTAMAGYPVELSVVEEPAEIRLGDYERLLGDAIIGDATLFARQDVVEAAWAIVDPLFADPDPIFEYEPGSWGPPQADRLVAEVGGWHTPQ